MTLLSEELSVELLLSDIEDLPSDKKRVANCIILEIKMKVVTVIVVMIDQYRHRHKEISQEVPGGAT